VIGVQETVHERQTVRDMDQKVRERRICDVGSVRSLVPDHLGEIVRGSVALTSQCQAVIEQIYNVILSHNP